jgi:hypothetical protein
MKYLIGLLGLIAIVAISLTSVAWVLDDTLLSAKYLNRQANQSGLYDQLAEKLPESLAKQTSQPEATKTALELIVTPDSLQTQVAGWFDQIEAYYKQNGPVPKLEFKDIQDQAGVYNVPIPTGPPFDKPLLWQDPGIKPLADRLVLFKTFGPFICMGLLLVIFMLGHGWKRQLNVAKVLLISAAILGVLFLLSSVIPSLISGALGSTESLKFMADSVGVFGKQIASDIAARLGQIAIGLATGALLLFPLAIVGKLGSKVGRHKETNVKDHGPSH